MSFGFIALCIMIAGCLVLLGDGFLVSSQPPAKGEPSSRNDSSFLKVEDSPLLTSLDSYNELMRTGQSVIMIGDETHTIHIRDLTSEDRQRLQLQLKTP